MSYRSLAWLCLAVGMPAAWGQVSGAGSLTGKYFFRQVLFVTDLSGNVLQTLSAFGTLTFDGIGSFTVAGQELVDKNPPVALTSGGNYSYSVKPGGFVTMIDPLRPDVKLNARVGPGALVGSSTESGGAIFDVLLAVPAPSFTTQASVINRPYSVSTLEFPGGGVGLTRNSFFQVTANGAGSFGDTTVAGQAVNLGNKLLSQAVAGINYSLSADGSATVTFPAATGADPNSLLVSGTKTVYFSPDASFFIGGSAAAGGHGLMVGVKGWGGNANNASWLAKYWGAGLRLDGGELSAFVGSANAVGTGSVVWTQRVRQTDAVLDLTTVYDYSLKGDGSGTVLGSRMALASTGQTFFGTAVGSSDSSSYSLYFGMPLATQSGSGVFLNPLGVLNAASLAPPGTPISPGEVIALFGTGFGGQAVTVQGGQTFPTTLDNVQVTINGSPIPLYSVTALSGNQGLVSGQVPFSLTGATATIAIISKGTKSNSVDVPVAATSPGVFTVPPTGIAEGAIRDLDYVIVNGSHPAKRGAYVQVYLTGLGATSPPVVEGVPAPGTSFSNANTPLQVYIGGVPVPEANIQFKGLVPTVAGLYQINVLIPAGTPAGMQPLVVVTPEAVTDMVTIAIAK